MTYFHYIDKGDFWEKYVYEDYMTYLVFEYSMLGTLQEIRYFKTYILNTENMTKYLYDYIEIKKTYAYLLNPVAFEFSSVILVLLILAPILAKCKKKNSLK